MGQQHDEADQDAFYRPQDDLIVTRAELRRHYAAKAGGAATSLTTRAYDGAIAHEVGLNDLWPIDHETEATARRLGIGFGLHSHPDPIHVIRNAAQVRRDEVADCAAVERGTA